MISRGAKTEAAVVVCTVSEGDFTGRGECVPYARYGETPENVVAAIESVRQQISSGIDRNGLISLMKAGAARNAVDCALWDIEAKLSGKPARMYASPVLPRPLVTAVTISLGTPEEMAAQAAANAHRPLLKVKVGSGNDAALIAAVANSAPQSRIILDANEGWSTGNIVENLAAAAANRVELIEQPLPAGGDAILREIARPVPVCADESIHSANDLEALVGLYDAVNIKLDKAGGLTAAIELRDRARALGFGVMVGCMVGSSLSMAPATLLAQDADFVDLDGPLLLARDRDPGLRYEGSTLFPPMPELWG